MKKIIWKAKIDISELSIKRIWCGTYLSVDKIPMIAFFDIMPAPSKVGYALAGLVFNMQPDDLYYPLSSSHYPSNRPLKVMPLAEFNQIYECCPINPNYLLNKIPQKPLVTEVVEIDLQAFWIDDKPYIPTM